MSSPFYRHTSCFPLARRSIALIVILLIACIVPIQSPREVSAQISCTTFNHCHAVVDWSGSVIGSYTSLYVAPMYDNHDVSSFIDNEMWLIDSSTPSCQRSPTLDCLVEAGYKAVQGGVQYFVEEHYAYQGVVYHPLDYIPTDGTGDFGSNVTVLLEQTSYGYYYIEMQSPHKYFAGYSEVSMNPSRIDIGQEISGDTSGIFADPASWNSNIYIQNYNNYYQFSDGSLTINPPSSAYWQPDPPNSSTGGTWIACTTGC